MFKLFLLTENVNINIWLKCVPDCPMDNKSASVRQIDNEPSLPEPKLIKFHDIDFKSDKVLYSRISYCCLNTIEVIWVRAIA